MQSRSRPPRIATILKGFWFVWLGFFCLSVSMLGRSVRQVDGGVLNSKTMLESSLNPHKLYARFGPLQHNPSPGCQATAAAFCLLFISFFYSPPPFPGETEFSRRSGRFSALPRACEVPSSVWRTPSSCCAGGSPEALSGAGPRRSVGSRREQVTLKGKNGGAFPCLSRCRWRKGNPLD